MVKQLEPQLESQLELQQGSLRDKVIYLLSKDILSKSEISAKLGQKGTSGQLNKVIKELLEAGYIAYTIPEKPSSGRQQYKLIKTPDKRPSKEK